MIEGSFARPSARAQPLGRAALDARRKNHQRRRTSRPRRNPYPRKGPAHVHARQRVVDFAEKERGSLEVGKLADLAVLSKDYFKVPVEEIGEIEAVIAMVGGRVVYAGPV